MEPCRGSKGWSLVEEVEGGAWRGNEGRAL